MRPLKVVQPEKYPSLLNPHFVYTKGSNVQAIWRKHGWVPPTEYRNDYEFKRNRDIK